ncbi:hypothetical protein [Thalassotalea sp. PS06]|uniref:hypothetical protein n=1 Tax=Thalassotalea sp. PS06 TaxID=2594005 RepID=UPI0011629A05|nr:hypothetical protein [Thalassotalea sp. PS06]QDP00868.1 hypothetical protein FNC98_05595 [Thalassotalea sp. PS06]
MGTGIDLALDKANKMLSGWRILVINAQNNKSFCHLEAIKKHQDYNLWCFSLGTRFRVLNPLVARWN